MTLSASVASVRRWFRWLTLPPPWWIALGFVAAVGAVWLCASASRWAPAVAVLYQVGGAVLAVWQFISLQQDLNPEWLTREVRDWWTKRPRKLNATAAGAHIVLEPATARAYGCVTHASDEPAEEQLRQIWRKLGEFESNMRRMDDDVKLQEKLFDKRLVSLRGEALSFTKAAEERLSQSITSAPLQAAVGLWLLLLGTGMQVWLALP